MKKVLSLILVMILLCTFLQLTAIGAGKSAPAITLDTVSAKAGDEVTVKVRLNNNPGIISACINVAFDKGLTLVGAENGNVFPASMTFVPPKQLSKGGSISGNCNFAWSGTDIKDKDIKDGVILSLTFSVFDKAEGGKEYGIAVTSRKGDIVDKNLSAVEISTAKGQVTVAGQSASSDSDGESPKSVRNFFDWFKRLIEKIKEIFSRFVKS